MRQGLRIAKVQYDEMVAHCQREYPKEACGILAGKNGIVERVQQMVNLDNSSISYQMDSAGQLRVMKQMREQHHEMLAIYHSHTASEAHPSPVDVSLAVYPEVSYVLVSLQDRQRPVVKSYQIQGTTVTEEEVFKV